MCWAGPGQVKIQEAARLVEKKELQGEKVCSVLLKNRPHWGDVKVKLRSFFSDDDVLFFPHLKVVLLGVLLWSFACPLYYRCVIGVL